MAAITYQGVNYAWVNVTFVWYTQPVTWIKSISGEKKQKTDLNYGAGVEPISEAIGNNEYTLDIEVYRDEWDKIIAAAPNNDPLQIPRSDMQIVFGGDRVNTKVDVWKGVKFTNDPMSVKQNDTSIILKLKMSCVGLEHK
jgi:hypothetical protein